MTGQEAAPRDALSRLLAMTPPRPPERGVVYRHLDADGAALYVGSTTVLAMRTRQLTHARAARWWRFVVVVKHEKHENRRAALDAERAEIHAKLPIFNRNRPGDVEEHETAEAVYLAAHPDVHDEWGPALRSLRKLDPVTRRGRIDVLLRTVGVGLE